MFQDASHLQEIADRIGMPCNVVATTGIGYGVYIKYRTFYLTAYDNDRTDAYRIAGYLYDNKDPIFEFVVPRMELGKFTDQIRKDDYLKDPIKKNWNDPVEYNGSGPKIY